MKAVLHVNNAAHQKQHVAWMVEGFNRHGITSIIAEYDVPAKGDFAVIWGWKQRAVIERCENFGMPILVMERGHLQPRMEFTSLGWDGLAGRAKYPSPDVCGGRWERHWGAFEPWRAEGSYALVIGQVRGDASLYGVSFEAWAQSVTDQLILDGHTVRYRPHPLMVRHKELWRPKGAEFSTRSLEDDLSGASVCVTYNSTTGVEAVLAGVPTVTFDRGAMAWPVTTHDLECLPVTPDRAEWVERLACCQWNEDEIRSGEAWEAVSTCLQKGA